MLDRVTALHNLATPSLNGSVHYLQTRWPNACMSLVLVNFQLEVRLGQTPPTTTYTMDAMHSLSHLSFHKLSKYFHVSKIASFEIGVHRHIP